MNGGTHSGLLAALFASALLAACASAPAPRQPSGLVFEQPVDATPSLNPGEQRILNRAEAFERQQRWLDAVQQWEVLQLMRPDEPEYAQRLHASQASAKKVAAQQLEAAEQARKQGQNDQAMRAYLKSLSMDPLNQRAFEGLRQLESDRAAAAHLHKNHINVMAERNKTTTPKKVAPAAYGGARQVLDVGILLFHQGNYPASIQQLEAYLRSDPQDESGRGYLVQAHLKQAQQFQRAGKKEDALASMEKAFNLKGRADPELADSIKSLRHSLAESYYDKAVRIYYLDIDKAVGFWERALELNPNHKLSLHRLQQANKARKHLKALDGASKP